MSPTCEHCGEWTVDPPVCGNCRRGLPPRTRERAPVAVGAWSLDPMPADDRELLARLLAGWTLRPFGLLKYTHVERWL